MNITPKQFVFVEDGAIEVRANSVAELKIALKEFKLLKREFRLKKMELASRIRALRPTVRQAVRLSLSPAAAATGTLATIAEANEMKDMLASAEAGLTAYDGLIRQTEQLAIQVETLILKNAG